MGSKVHLAGQGWTGALGSGTSTMTHADTSAVSSSQRDNDFSKVEAFDNNVTDIATGWGHTALVHDDRLYVAGRPYDFQNLLRLNRMPPFIRRLVVHQGLFMEKDERDIKSGGGGGLLDKAVDLLFQKDENEEYSRSVFPNFVEMPLPDGDTPASRTHTNTHHKNLAASAGVTAIIGAKEGKVYTFGLNNRGQCGIGEKKTPHVWKPTPVTFKTEDIDDVADIDRSDSCNVAVNIKSVDLGLQHGLLLDDNGKLYGFGKGARGQLGKAEDSRRGIEIKDLEDDSKESTIDMEFAAICIRDFEVRTAEYKSFLTGNDAKVSSMSAGWNHSAAITGSNHVFVWGKNATAEWDDKKSSFKAKDSPSPTIIHGLPSNLEIKHVSCGSHHTAILMEDGSVYATGISTDTVDPIGKSAVQIVPPGLIDIPVQQFVSHFDRTTIVAGHNGQQVLEVQLWSTEKLRDTAVFEPEWVEPMLAENASILRVERGWLHTAVIAA